MNIETRYHNFSVDNIRARRDVHIYGQLIVEGEIIHNKPMVIPNVSIILERLEKLEKENKELREIVTRLQYHPDSPYVDDVAQEWYEKLNNK